MYAFRQRGDGFFDQRGRKLATLRKDELVDRQGHEVGTIRGDDVFDRKGHKVATIRGNRVFDDRGHHVIDVDDVRRLVDDAADDASVVAFWLFFVRR